MTTVAVLAAPPHPGAVGDAFVDAGVLDETEAAELYGAQLRDVCAAVDASGAELLVNYRPADRLPEDAPEPEAALREVLEPILTDPDAVRYEVQVGSTRSARVGNTVTHLLEREGVRTAGVTWPAAALLARGHVDEAAMKLRSADVLLGPSTDGRVSYAAFAEPVDFTDAFADAALTTIGERASEADLETDLLPVVPRLDGPDDVADVAPVASALSRAGRPAAPRTLSALDDLGLAGE